VRDRSPSSDKRALVLEDDPLIRDRLSASLAQLGLEVQPLHSIDDALDAMDCGAPDLIVVSHEIGGECGMEFVQQVRKDDPSHWIPILMIGHDVGGSWEAQALQSGCDDYLTRTFATEVLFAKLASMIRMRKLRRFSEVQRAELAAFRHRAETEADLARFLLSRLSRVENLNAAGVAYHWIPAEGFSGDLLAATRSSGGALYGLLADATGHGLAAAINLIPLTTAFYAMAGKGFNLMAIAEQLNKVVKDHSLPDRFVAVTLARFAPREGRLEVVNAGNPPALLLDRKRQILREIRSGSIPLGILDRPLFKPKVEVCELSGDEELCMFSDGLIEACNFDGEAFGDAGIHKALAQAAPGHEGVAHALRDALAAHCIGVAPSDDVSVMVLRPPLDDTPPSVADALPSLVRPQEPDSDRSQRCTVEVSFSSVELQRVDVVPVIVGLTRSIGLSKTLESRFFTILSELYVNALDHGLLCLDSSVKVEPDGFERYFMLRSERLAALEDGQIVIRLDHHYGRNGGGRMQIEMTDSGAGFDHQRVLRALLNPELGEGTGTPSGRGLALLLTLCDEVHFNEAGNMVTVAFGYR
jgi:serine phosphatase RsbU (regulator of sigma subunit)/anti-sigma regulatory factor (Ser/Thr protein kinase)